MNNPLEQDELQSLEAELRSTLQQQYAETLRLAEMQRDLTRTISRARVILIETRERMAANSNAADALLDQPKAAIGTPLRSPETDTRDMVPEEAPTSSDPS